MLRSKIIIDDLSLNTSRMLTWREEWISEYESPWGIIEKFRYANAFSVDNIFDILGADNTKNKKIKSWSQKERDLITLYGLSKSQVKSVLGFDMHNSNRYYHEKNFGIDISLKHMKKYLRDTVFYCPECFKIGYHSIWFQNTMVKKCPFHNIPLQEKCPVCNKSIPYEIDKGNAREPFKCFCGYSYFNDSNQRIFSDIWEENKSLEIISPELLSWESLNSKHLDKLKLIYFDGKSVKNPNSDIINLIISTISDNQYYSIKPTVKHYKTASIRNINIIKNTYGEKAYYLKIPNKEVRNLRDYKRHSPNKTVDLKYKDFYSDMYKSYRQILSSVCRYIRRKVIYKHKKCINKLLKNSTIIYNKDEKICPYAYAYIMWRKSVQNCLVSNLFQNKNEDINYTIAPDNSLMLDLLSDWKSRFGEKIFDNVIACRWVLYKVIAHIFISHYHNWLNISKNLSEINELDWNLYFEYEEIPAYIVRYFNSNEPYIEFHWSGNYKEIKSIPKVKIDVESKQIEEMMLISKRKKRKLVT